MKIGHLTVWFIAAVVFVLVDIVGGHNLLLETYRSWFGLKSISRVSDYRAASIREQLYWLKTMCNNGACLHSVDWKCGFSVDLDPDYDQKVDACFTTLARTAPLDEALGKLRLICGRQFMGFVGERFSTPKACADAGGQWGMKVKAFPDEDIYISQIQ